MQSVLCTLKSTNWSMHPFKHIVTYLPILIQMIYNIYSYHIFLSITSIKDCSGEPIHLNILIGKPINIQTLIPHILTSSMTESEWSQRLFTGKNGQPYEDCIWIIQSKQIVNFTVSSKLYIRRDRYYILLNIGKGSVHNSRSRLFNLDIYKRSEYEIIRGSRFSIVNENAIWIRYLQIGRDQHVRLTIEAVLHGTYNYL